MLSGAWPQVSIADTGSTGRWTVTISDPLLGTVDITTVRGFTTEIIRLVSTDPFGPSMAQLRFPGLSALDSLGEGDLRWWRPFNDIDIVWSSDLVRSFGPVRSEIRWEGYIAGESTSFTDDGGMIQMTCKGALMLADNTVVMPEYPQRPWPFEHAIAHALVRCRAANGNRFAPLRIEFPDDWPLVYRRDETEKWWLEPLAVQDGEKWSGLVTRETGQFNKALSDYIAGLLSSMHTPTGQFTLMVDPGRVPVLRHRDRYGDDHTALIDMVSPGVNLDITCDYEAKVDTVFGRGRGLDGISFSNMQFESSGATAYYLPFAHHQTTYPAQGNPYRRPGAVRRDVALTFHEGMSAAEAARAAELYRQRFARPGWTGTLSLNSDPYVETPYGRATVPRHTIVAGDAIRVLHFQGRDTGALFHVSEANHNIMDGSTSLTVDTVFRDHLTTEEVRLRGRDALTGSMHLTTGQYNVSIRDQLLPWGPDSGYLPVDSKALFAGVEEAAVSVTEQMPFPWEQLTMSRPPKDERWSACYVRIPAASPDVTQNWNTVSSHKNATIIQLSQAGAIQLLQVMAVDADGRRMDVPFHISFYMNTGTCAADMPKLNNRGWSPPLFPGTVEGPYPFFPGAWEQINSDGTVPQNLQWNLPAEGVGMVAGFGTALIPAGYYPGDPRNDGVAPTGMLSVQDAFSYDISGFQKDFDPMKPYDPDGTEGNSFKTSGLFGVMIYCDSVWDGGTGGLVRRSKDVYFVGRLFRKPAGSG